MIFRKATNEDLSAICQIYDNIHTAEEAGLATIGWNRDIYPTRDTAMSALERDDLYVCELSSPACEEAIAAISACEKTIAATAIINKTQVNVYADVEWDNKVSDDKVLVLHTLVIDPAMAHKGIGRGFVQYYEDCARELGCTELRMDTNERNKIAREFYAKLGYKEVGVVPTVFNGIPGVNLVMLEKKI